MNRKNYDLVDLSKFLLAIFVVSVHAGVPVAGWIGRIAVPYFFIVSGYFYFKKYNDISNDKERMLSYVGYAKRIVFLLMVWELMYLPIITYSIYLEGNFSLLKIGTEFLIGRLPGFGVAWYLCASIVGLGTLLLLMKFFRNSTLFIISIGIELFLIMISGYHGILSKWTHVFDNAFFNNLIYIFIRSWLYLLLGYWLSKNVKKISFISNRYFFPIFGLFLLEHYWLNEYKLWGGGIGTDETFLVPALAFICSVVTLTSNVKIANAIELRKLSTFIYLSHFVILFVQRYIMEHYFGVNVSWINWGITVMLVMMLYFVASRSKRIIEYIV